VRRTQPSGHSKSAAFLIVFSLDYVRVPACGLHARVSAVAAILLLSCANQSPTFARGSQVGHDDPWNPEHIDRLPPEVRYAVSRMCRDSPRAGHYFATYFDNAHSIKLHFEHLHCGDQAIFCRADSCLHQEYVSAGAHYRLIKAYYGRRDD